jgi:hypothetical protein
MGLTVVLKFTLEAGLAKSPVELGKLKRNALEQLVLAEAMVLEIRHAVVEQSFNDGLLRSEMFVDKADSLAQADWLRWSIARHLGIAHEENMGPDLERRHVVVESHLVELRVLEERARAFRFVLGQVVARVEVTEKRIDESGGASLDARLPFALRPIVEGISKQRTFRAQRASVDPVDLGDGSIGEQDGDCGVPRGVKFEEVEIFHGDRV